MNKLEELTPVLIIEDFPSRNELILILQSFMKEFNYKEKYNISNNANSLKIVFPEPDMAYNFLKRINMEKVTNLLYQNIKCNLSFKTKFKNKYKNCSSSYHNIFSGNNNFNYKVNCLRKSETKSRLLTQKSINDLSSGSYEHKHWKSISEKAGIITGDSPYLSKDEYLYRDNGKHWINKKNFNVFVGRASSNHSYFIKNYVNITPSIPPVLYNFRPVDKSKWISKKGFSVC